MACIHSEDPDPTKRLHCAFETRVSKAGMFQVIKNAKRYDAGNTDWFDGRESPFRVFPYIWKVVGDCVLHMDMGDYGETQKIAVFTLHEDCPKGAPGVNVHIAVWLVGPDGFTPLESTNDAVDAYFYFKGLLQEARDVKFTVAYIGAQRGGAEGEDASNEAAKAPTDALGQSSPQTGTQTRPNGGKRQDAP